MHEKIYRDADVDLSVLKGKTIAVIGYGIQAKAQAANCADTKRAALLPVALTHAAQPSVYKLGVAPPRRPGQTLCCCHGFSALHGQNQPPKDINVAHYVPNAPGACVGTKWQTRERPYGRV